MKLRSNRVLKRAKPKFDSNIKNQDSSNKKRLSLRSGKSYSGIKRANESDIRACDDGSEEDLEMSMNGTLNTDDKGLFLDPIEDSVVSCSKEEIEEQEQSSLMPEISESGRKRKTAMSLRSDCTENERAKKKKVEKDSVRVADGKLLRSRTLTGVNTVVDDGVRRVVLGLKQLDENTRPKVEISSPPLIKIQRKKVEPLGRPPKTSHEIPIKPMSPHGLKRKLHVKDNIFKKFKRRGRPPKIKAQTLATHMIKTRSMKHRLIVHNLKVQKSEEKIEPSEGILGNLERRALKQLVRDKVSNLLVKSGWTIGFRQREEKDYKDSVYIEPNGKRTHWTITKAYDKLKDKIESGEADNFEIAAFTPIPEEEISILYRHQEKIRKDKNMKRNMPYKKSKIVTDETFKNVKGKIVTGETLKNVKSKIVTDKKKPGKKTKDGSKRKMKDGSKSKMKDGSKREMKDGSKRKMKDGSKSKMKDGSKRKMIKPRLLARGPQNGSKQDNEGVLVIKKRNLLSWMIDSGVILAGTKIQYRKTRRQKTSSEGIISSDGIRCGCCDKVLGLTAFVVHCGGQIGEVFDKLYLESGRCFRNCLMDSWRKEDINSFNAVDVEGGDPNDDTCNICGDGGNLICCDGCPSTFHQSCLDIQNFPSGDWNCIYCTCKFCGEVSDNTPQMLSCCLCEEKYHQSCLQEVETENIDSNKLPFCGSKCEELFERLQTYIGVKHELEDGLSWTLLKRSDVDQKVNCHDTRLKVEQNSKLAVAFSVMDECFVPIIDGRSGTSIIHDVVYNCGSNFRRLNYSGFLTAVLEKDDEFITAASIRLHGSRLAEMPFIGTRHMYRRQGMCRRLLDAIEHMLSSLGVEELIIPAIPALLQTWMNVFGFMPIEELKKQEMKKTSMLVFPGIDMLKKPLQIQFADVNRIPSLAGVEKDVINHKQKEEICEPNDENAPQFEDDILPTSRDVNGLCDLNLPVKNVVPSDTDGQTSVDSGSSCTVDPSPMDSLVCGNRQSPELMLDAENDGVLGVKVKPLTSESVLKNTFDLNLEPTAVENDLHVISDDSVQCDSRSPVDHSAGG